MKRSVLPALAILFVLMACNNSGKKKENPGTGQKSQADSLMKDVMDGHNAGMANYGKMKGMLKKLQSSMDSIDKLSARVRDAAAPYKAKLSRAADDLSAALKSMDTWMDEFNMDSAVDNLEARIHYLADERMKIGKVKESIMQGLHQADSVLEAGR